MYLAWGPVVASAAGSALAWWVGGTTVIDVVGVPPARWWYWPAAATGWSVHTDVVHLVTNCVLWVWSVRATSMTALTPRRVAGTAVAGVVAGAGAWWVMGDDRGLVGLSGAVCAVGVLVVVFSRPPARWWAVVIVGLYLLPWPGTSWWSHTAAVAVGGAGAWVLAAPAVSGVQGRSWWVARGGRYRTVGRRPGPEGSGRDEADGDDVDR